MLSGWTGNPFPLVQLPKKFRDQIENVFHDVEAFPLVQLPKKFREWKSGLVFRTGVKFPLVQLPKKFRVWFCLRCASPITFPLVQLPKKFRDVFFIFDIRLNGVSISSTSEEVQSGSVLHCNGGVKPFPLVQLPKKFRAGIDAHTGNAPEQVSISSTSEEVQS